MHRILEILLDIIAPKDPKIKAIEAMSVADFCRLNTFGGNLGEEYGVKYLFPYKNETVKTALVEIKNFPNKKVATIIGQSASALLAGRLPDNPLLVPIPITKKKRRMRGWNQCDLLVNAMHSSEIEIRFDVLEKIRDTADQVGKNRKERFLNLRDSFSVKNPAVVAGRNMVVLDDILTTGSTLTEAKRVLIDAGAKTVTCIAIAH